MTAPDASVEASDDVSEAGENETLAESTTTQPDAEAEAGPSELAARLRAGAEQLRATLRAQRERAQTLAAQLQELKRAQVLLRKRVETMTPSP